MSGASFHFLTSGLGLLVDPPVVDGVVPATCKRVAGVLGHVQQELAAAQGTTEGTWDGAAASWFHAVSTLERARAGESAQALQQAAGVAGLLWEAGVAFTVEMRRISQQAQDVTARWQAVAGPGIPLPDAELTPLVNAMQAALDRLEEAARRGRGQLLGLAGITPTRPPTPRPRARGGFASAVHPGLGGTQGWSAAGLAATATSMAALATTGGTDPATRRRELVAAGDTAGVATLDRLEVLSARSAPTNAELAELRALQGTAATGVPGPATPGPTVPPATAATMAGTIREPAAVRRALDGTVSLLAADHGHVVRLGAGGPGLQLLGGAAAGFDDEATYGPLVEVPEADELEQLLGSLAGGS